MKKYLYLGLALIIILGSLFLPKILRKDQSKVSFKEVQNVDIPEKIAEVLPKYIMEERALTCKYKDNIYVIVTRGEKKSKGYSVEIDKIVKEIYSKENFDLVVHAKFKDPVPNEMVSQEYDYPYIVVKTNLKEMPKEIHLDIEYYD